MILAGVGLAFFAAISVFDPSEKNTGWALLVVSAVTAAPILLGLRIRGQRNLWTLLWAASLAVLAVAFGYLLGGEGLVLAWSAQAALAACVAVFAREERLQLAGAGYLGLAIAHTLAYDARPDELFERFSTFALAPIVYVALGGAVAAVALHRGKLRPSWGPFAAGVAGGAAAVYAGSFFLLDMLAVPAGRGGDHRLVGGRRAHRPRRRALAPLAAHALGLAGALQRRGRKARRLRPRRARRPLQRLVAPRLRTDRALRRLRGRPGRMARAPRERRSCRA